MMGLQTYMTNKDDVQIQAVLRHQELKGSSLCIQGSWEIPDRGWNNTWHDQWSWQVSHLEGQTAEASSTRKTSRRWWGISGGKMSCMESSPAIWTRIMWMQNYRLNWMKLTGLKREPERLITAAQDQALNTRHYSKHIIKQGTTDRCRMCHTQPETVEHLTSGCQALAADQYLNRLKQIAAQLHLDICKHYGIKVEAEYWYQHKPEWVMEDEKATILWDSPIIADRHVPCNKPYIVI